MSLIGKIIEFKYFPEQLPHEKKFELKQAEVIDKIRVGQGLSNSTNVDWYLCKRIDGIIYMVGPHNITREILD